MGLRLDHLVRHSKVGQTQRGYSALLPWWLSALAAAPLIYASTAVTTASEPVTWGLLRHALHLSELLDTLLVSAAPALFCVCCTASLGQAVMRMRMKTWMMLMTQTCCRMIPTTYPSTMKSHYRYSTATFPPVDGAAGHTLELLCDTPPAGTETHNEKTPSTTKTPCLRLQVA